MLVYTSVTKSYIPKARVLAKSVKKYHPDWYFVLLLSDNIPTGFNLDNEPFDEVLRIEDLGISEQNKWIFKHTVVELCTAVKGPAAKLLSQRDSVDKIMYIDPDIMVFNSLEPLSELLNKHDILLTPHLLAPEESDDAIIDNELSSLKHGVFNLGFFAARTDGEGLKFIEWWASRLLKFCEADIPNGMFTDQKWCDLAPCYFDNLHIIKDKGYNVATWNIHHRRIEVNSNNEFTAGGDLLRFYHFTSYDNGDGLGMLHKYGASQPCAFELWKLYGMQLIENGNEDVTLKHWNYQYFENGEKILESQRKLYRKRIDLQEAFPNPYSSELPSYLNWFKNEAK